MMSNQTIHSGQMKRNEQPTQDAADQQTTSDVQEKHVLVIDASYGSTVALIGGSAHVQTDTRAHVEQLVPNIKQVLEDSNLDPAQITHVVVGTGPAPFTGLRAGIVAARAFAFAHGAELCGQDVLEPQAVWCADNAAQQAIQEYPTEDCGDVLHHCGVTRHLALVVNDARRRQLYWRLYDITESMRSQVLPQPLTDIDITAPVDIPAVIHDVVRSTVAKPVTLYVIGEGVKRYLDQLEAVGDFCTHVIYNEHSLWHVNPQLAAQYMWRTAGMHHYPAQTEPIYVRRPDVSVPNPLKHVLGSGAVHHHE